MDLTGEPSARGLAAALGQDAINRRTAFQWAHPSWCGTLLPAGIDCAVGLLGACAPRWLELHGAPPLALGTHGDAAGVLAALPIDAALALLRVRALWPRRGELRHWIDRARRAQLVELVGAKAAQALRGDSASAASVPAWLAKAPPLDTMSAETLAWEGYCLFSRDDAWPEAREPLARLALPRHAREPAWLMTYRTDRRANDSEAALAYSALMKEPEDA